MPLPFLLSFQRSAHDAGALLDAWSKIAADAHLQATTLLVIDDFPIVAYHSQVMQPGGPGIYLSSGVHGDEAGSAWGLAQWGSENIARLQTEPFLICPCLNPAGLIANTRADQRGLDINRRFHITDDPLTGPWTDWLSQWRPHAGICLHEDYDAPGCYVYELSDHAVPVCTHAMTKVDEIIPRDARTEIEGRDAANGILHVSRVPPDVEGPEAIVLRRFGCNITLTFETPSEFAVDLRVRAQQSFIHHAIEQIAVHSA